MMGNTRTRSLQPIGLFVNNMFASRRSFQSSISCLQRVSAAARQRRYAWTCSSSAEKQGAIEDARFESSVHQLKKRWEFPSRGLEGIKRPYSAESVVAKRGSLDLVFPSSEMARKLAYLLHDKASKGEPLHTSKLDGA